jgi:hypothetical protein
MESRPLGQNYLAELINLDKAGDGNWVGFMFPESVSSSKDLIFKSEINLSDAEIHNFALAKVRFEGGLVAENATVRGKFALKGGISNALSLVNSRFDKQVILRLDCKAPVNMNSAEFSGPVEISGSYEGRFNANSCVFRDRVNFRGNWRHYAGTEPPHPSERRPLFYDEFQFQDVFLESPSKLIMRTVSLEKAFLAGTNFIGAQFRDVTWAEPEPGRKGIYDETFAANATGETVNKQLQPVLEATYRNLRAALERNREFSTATDFYVGEMLARKRLRVADKESRNWIEDLYGFLSNYGSSPKTAMFWLAFLLLVHLGLSQFLICVGPSVSCEASWSWPNFADQLTHSLKTMTLQRFAVPLEGALPYRFLLDTVFMILAPIQVAILILAIRGRIRR